MYEAPFDLTTEMKDDIFKRYREGIGWKPMSEYSDPLGMLLPSDPAKRTKKAIEAAMGELDKTTDRIVDY